MLRAPGNGKLPWLVTVEVDLGRAVARSRTLSAIAEEAYTHMLLPTLARCALQTRAYRVVSHKRFDLYGG